MSDLIERQAAIDAWKNDFKGYVNALDMPRDDYNGIMAYIDEVPSATQTNAPNALNALDCISRQAAIDAVRRLQTYKLSEGDDMVLVDKAEVQTELMMLPAEQPEIVRCKDCKYSSPNHVYGCRLEPFDANERDERMYSNDYCSKAILRGEQDE